MPNSSGALALTFIVLNPTGPMEQVCWSSDVNFVSLCNFRSKRSSLRQLANYIKDKRQTPCSCSRGLCYCCLASIKTRKHHLFFFNLPLSNSMKIRSAVLGLLRADGQTDRLDETIMQCAFLLRLRRKRTLAWVAYLKRKLTD
jgi:hypothetical protein